ncbi:serine hydrolase [Fangia hongkongensis]|uniref:serine hydrolase n=2 Tax=Fangia hongkongensis TaxID=270495 RepID=UPI00036739A9|nr:serine hydrolase [Fangia hongkongensis]
MIKLKPIFLFATCLFSSSALANSLPCTPLENSNTLIQTASINQLINQGIYKMGQLPGLLVGVVANGKTQLFSCGETVKGNNIRPTGDTIWQIGSVSKVLTTSIFAMMVDQGKITLTAKLQDNLPKGTTVPSYQGRSITLLDLATHTSGLPREITGLNKNTTFQSNESFNQNRAYKWLSQYQLTIEPGTHYQYSNIGFGLLGNALAYHEKTTYAELIHSYLNQQLEMKNTTVKLTEKQKKDQAKSYWFNGTLIKSNWQFNFNQPSGGVYSTGDDLLRFIQYNLNLLSGNDFSANQIAHATYIYRDALDNKLRFSDSGMALGWSVDDPENGLPIVLHKNGWVSGFNTWVILLPTEKIGIFSISNKPYLAIKGQLLSIARLLMNHAQQK